MNPEKSEGWKRKRKARDKANLRLVKNKHWIAPSMFALVGAGFLVGGSLALGITEDFQHRIIIALSSALMFLFIGAHRVIYDLSTSTEEQ